MKFIKITLVSILLPTLLYLMGSVSEGTTFIPSWSETTRHMITTFWFAIQCAIFMNHNDFNTYYAEPSEYIDVELIGDSKWHI